MLQSVPDHLQKIKVHDIELAEAIRRDTARWNACQACPLSKTRCSVVYGRGKVPCDVLFIGEAPGQAEDRAGIPFVGRSGRLLHLALTQAASLAGKPVPDYFITNMLGCHPTQGPDRPHRLQELESCRPRVQKILDVTQPKAVVFIGRVAWSQRENLAFKGGAFFATHPSALLRRGGALAPDWPDYVQKLAELFKQL